MIKCNLGKVYDVAERLVDEIEETPTVYSISGDFDLLAQFSVHTTDDIGRFVNDKVQTIAGVANTKTIICFNAFTKDSGYHDDV
ncbi:Lrp/AsnC ligand binding domain-containing protein [Kordiimonas pumila]|uniref:Lrp/AsnC ligand binding domain-containing protein n=1 Tax=Kordiimonas pumila TaxID=2161677 RepID=A0ABV7D4X3_9PROT|nr:Lrp/AsnC ligand binding domain-containing protein [Kordiimonas pumila]